MEHNIADHVRTGWQKHKKPVLIVGGVVIGIAILLTAGCFVYMRTFDGRIYPNVSIDSIDVGGLTQKEAYALVDMHLQEMLDEGLELNVEGTTLSIDLRAQGTNDPDLVNDLVYVNIDSAVDTAFRQARTDRSARDLASALWLALRGNTTIYPDATILKQDLEGTIRKLMEQEELDILENPGEPTHYTITTEGAIDVVGGSEGQAYDFDTLFAQLEESARNLSIEPMTLELVEQTVNVSVQEADTLLSRVVPMVQAAPFTATYTSQYQRTYEWTIDKDDIVAWIIPHKIDDNISLTLDGDAYDAFLEDLHNTIDVKAQDARFQIEGSRVTEFIASQNGVTVDDKTTSAALLDALEHAEMLDELDAKTIEVITMETEADITTDSVNNLGINEILGVGISDFSGSPSNRIANIKHGASKLNGILIAPGETLSLIDRLGPFTVADGYLPELVIKGDEIKPEVGGGLCQIGTTTFRATMNAGLEVVERRNHSLVVSYYNDPSNGNPGTDATIYDPAPDYKMRNDTDNYILLTTEVDMSNYELIFTFWGTSDGREGYYSAPQILSWSGYGETQYIETTDLAPGVEKCQSPHPGATTSFTYYVDYEDGTQHEKTYTSTYRSLPWICLVGVEALSCDPEVEECEENRDGETTSETSDDSKATDTTDSESEEETTEATVE